MLVLAIILGIFLLIGLTPVGVDASFMHNVLKVSAKVGPLKITVFPTVPKVEKAAKRVEAKEMKKAEKEGARPSMELILQLVKLGLRALGRFRRRLHVRHLTVHYVAAGDDPYQTALQYGAITAALNALAPLSDRVLKIRHKDIRADLSFETDKPAVAARLVAVIAIGDLVYIGLALAVEYLAYRRRIKRAVRIRDRNEERTSDYGKQ